MQWPTRTSLRLQLDAMAWHLLPGICVLCNARSNAALDLCGACFDALPWLAQGCPQCALPLPGDGGQSCGACAARRPPFVRTVAPMRYAAPVSRMILRLKFGGSSVDARVLGGLLAQAIYERYAVLPPVDRIVPVPLGYWRLLRRGHNQAALLARWISHHTGIPADYAVCTRRRNTVAQTDLGRRARLLNLRGAFAVQGNLDGQRIAIVDDVMTTGATATSLARVLLASGATEVHVWAVARTLEPQPHP